MLNWLWMIFWMGLSLIFVHIETVVQDKHKGDDDND